MLRFFSARDWNPCLRDAVRQGTSTSLRCKPYYISFLANHFLPAAVFKYFSLLLAEAQSGCCSV